MNWTLTPAQKRARAFAMDPGRNYSSRYSNEDLLTMLVKVYREKKRPPLEADVPTKRSTIARRFGGFPEARELARERLTPEEREEYQWRCPYCGRACEDPRGLGSHMRACKKQEDQI